MHSPELSGGAKQFDISLGDMATATCEPWYVAPQRATTQPGFVEPTINNEWYGSSDNGPVSFAPEVPLCVPTRPAPISNTNAPGQASPTFARLSGFGNNVFGFAPTTPAGEQQGLCTTIEMERSFSVSQWSRRNRKREEGR